jgi:c-di-GMP-binding flagellar brake protein YcgR
MGFRRSWVQVPPPRFLSTMDPEKRKAARIKKTLNLQYLSSVQGEEPVWIRGVLGDISESGMSFTSDKQFSAEQIISIRIRFPFNLLDWVELKGRCVAVKGLSVGMYILHLEFIDLQDEQKKVIKDYVTWVLEKAKEKE